MIALLVSAALFVLQLQAHAATSWQVMPQHAHTLSLVHANSNAAALRIETTSLPLHVFENSHSRAHHEVFTGSSKLCCH
jgi:hypothetical protein